MRNQLLTAGIILFLITIALSGCDELDPDVEKQSTTLSDGTIVTGDIGQIQITEHTVNKTRIMTWNEKQQIWKMQDGKIQDYNNIYSVSFYSKSCEVPWNLNIDGIDTDIIKRKEIYLTYIETNENAWIQDERIPIVPFTAYTHHYDYSPPEYWEWKWDGYFENPEHGAYVVTNLTLDNQSIWYVKGSAKNIGDTSIHSPKIIVNCYNVQGAWLASENHMGTEIPVGYTWDFSIRYDGEFRNDISYISFEV